jgi:hypothetical protein
VRNEGSNNIDYSLMGFIGRWNAVYDSGKRKVTSLDGLYSLNNEKNGLNFKEITKGNKSKDIGVKPTQLTNAT